MTTTEDRIINLLKDGTHSCSSGISVPGYTMHLDGFGGSDLKSIVYFSQEVLFNDIVCVKHKNDIINLEFW